MTSHEWHVIGAFGALIGAIALWDGKAAMQLLGVAAIVVVVRNADKLPTFSTSSKGKP